MLLNASVLVWAPALRLMVPTLLTELPVYYEHAAAVHVDYSGILHVAEGIRGVAEANDQRIRSDRRDGSVVVNEAEIADGPGAGKLLAAAEEEALGAIDAHDAIARIVGQRNLSAAGNCVRNTEQGARSRIVEAQCAGPLCRVESNQAFVIDVDARGTKQQCAAVICLKSATIDEFTSARSGETKDQRIRSIRRDGSVVIKETEIGDGPSAGKLLAVAEEEALGAIDAHDAIARIVGQRNLSAAGNCVEMPNKAPAPELSKVSVLVPFAAFKAIKPSLLMVTPEERNSSVLPSFAEECHVS